MKARTASVTVLFGACNHPGLSHTLFLRPHWQGPFLCSEGCETMKHHSNLSAFRGIFGSGSRRNDFVFKCMQPVYNSRSWVTTRQAFNNLRHSAENVKAPFLHGSADVSSLIFLCNLNTVSKPPQELHVNLSINLAICLF